MQNTLNDTEIYNLTIAFEYRLPFSNERIDLLMFGKYEKDRPKVVIFELKGWKYAEKKQKLLLLLKATLMKQSIQNIKLKTTLGK